MPKTYKCAVNAKDLELDSQLPIKSMEEPSALHDAKDERKYWEGRRILPV